jgi:PTH1 family peptidyl-tRNA hydrolase
MKFLIVGLGNIGAEYANTRHNIGFMVLDYFAKNKEVTFETKRYADVAEIKHKGKFIYLVKPSTYMNLSGKAVNYWLQELKITQENLLVITDDIALPFGKLRLRAKGSDGGHNGLKHINETLQSENYARMRIGIGNDFPKGFQAEYVLSPFGDDEQKKLPELLNQAQQAVLTFCLEGIAIAMNKHNKK